ncbi:MAG: CRTAC1 family protein [Gemmatimonadetes bacterium]|nr:CRTAC1 family protein [Gemmatimonadota bacterium]
MTGSSVVTRLSRKSKVWLSVGAMVLGVGTLVQFAFWAAERRETDLANPAAGITAEFRGGGIPLPAIRFRDVAAEMGVLMRHGPGPRGRTLPEDTGSGLAWGDYDGDGDWDLYVVNYPGALGTAPNPEGRNRLFRNDGDRFTDVTEDAGVGDPDGFGMGASFADYDGDGHMDLYVTNLGPNRLYRNRGNGTFEEVGGKAGVADPSWSTGAAWGDYNRDGYLDLYVCNYVIYEDEKIGDTQTLDVSGAYTLPFALNPNSFSPAPNRLYRNRGDGTFEEVAARLGVDDPRGRSLAATFVDLDGDRWLDLYVNNDVSANRLFRNMAPEFGTGDSLVFADLSTITGTADPRGSMGLSVAEIGEMAGAPDGLPDLFITHWVAQENALYQSLVTGGGLEYRDKSRQFDLGEISTDTVGWGSAFVDLDLDGRIDIAVANGSTLEEKDDPLTLIAEPMFLFWNDGAKFHDVAPKAADVLARRHSVRGLAAADFDGDGDVDLAAGVNRGAPLLLRNETQTGNRFLAVRLAASDAVRRGARVELEADGRRQYRWWGADVSFLSDHAPELVFGLGAASKVDRLSVDWSDGTTTVVVDIPAGRVENAR